MERLGVSIFIQLNQTVTQLKISDEYGIKKWSQGFNTFQDYLPRYLQITGAKYYEWPTAFGEDRKQEILEFALPCNYLKTLASEGWCLLENTFEASIGKLTEIEPYIHYQKQEKKKTQAKCNYNQRVVTPSCRESKRKKNRWWEPKRRLRCA